VAGATVLYDRDCGFCRWAVAKLLAWDRRGRLRAVAIQSPEGQALLADLAPEERLASAHAIDAAGQRYDGGAAAAPVVRLLPGGRPLAAALAAFPDATDRAYRWVARHRTPLGRLVPERAKRRAAATLER
jgi:predicted DCC family thiol-disulfide oxidoreductase YuxK